ncbi:hypothetical protein EDB85DRAFT_371530 [Lactarius pseudohatsudake]|nr:hypothetical protein EDB85DRAFT_371530 [Lactarius pseudohatsudake]
MMEASQHFELSRGPRTQVDEVHYNGNVHSLHQTQAIENVYYWYDGNVPFCTDATACRPLDDNFLPMNVHGYGYGYWYADKTQMAHPHQYMNVDHCVSAQKYPDPYDIHLHHHQAPFTNVTLFELAPLLNSPTSTSTPSLHSSNSESSSPGPCRHQEDATSDTLTALSPSKPQTEPPARSQSAETPVRLPGPRRPSSALAPVPTDPTNTGLDGVDRRAPKTRRTPRSVQPLACFFCRGRKIACGPPVNLGTGDRTCEPCARRRLVCEYPAESYRGRRPSGSKAASGRPQRR